MKILLTGGNGFFGKIIKQELEKTHQLLSLGRDSTNQITCDLSKEIPKIPVVDVIIHAAGKAHMIPKTKEENQEFFDTNVLGTANLLEGISIYPMSFIFISTVAVYGLEEGLDIDESRPLIGDSPYAKSKIEAENLIRKWGIQNQVNVLILRLPLIVGSDPPGNLGAMIKTIRSGFYRRIGEGSAKKSMVLAEDIARALPDWFDKNGTYNLTDGVHPRMAQLEDAIAQKFGKKVRKIPIWPISAIAKLGDLIPGFPLNTYRLAKLAKSLTFSDTKARTELYWSPRSVLDHFDPTK